ncbi:ABC transporter permease [Bacillus cereus]|uniref:ABC transporter permease n=1 Tax=Bacillus cereus TaxID=1396 RepID=A0A9X7GLQ9_BACCE|nr:ABC transporter permease [Bacillus cereus]PGO56274.1 ABC transporter permease [Bacillus cereus]
MDPKEYFSSDSNEKSNSLSPEKPMSIKSNRDCLEEINTKIPFCCTVNTPHGFQYIANETPKIAYNLDCVSVIEEKCKKTIQVDGCGPVEVTLNLLKVVGCIPYIANATVTGDCGSNSECDPHGKHHIHVCCSGSICVDNVLKCSIECLPHYNIHCHNVVISDFKVTPLQEHGCQLLQFTGMIEFTHIPYA